MPRFPSGSLRKLAAWALDYAAAVSWQVEGLVGARRPDDAWLATDKTQPPVVILPGVYEPWTYMRPLIRALAAQGHPVHVLSLLGYNRGQIPVAARMVAGYVADHRLADVVLVAHSKGGLVGKYLMTYHDPDRRIQRLVAVASPFSGSPYARWLWLPAVREFLPTAEVIAKLGEQSGVNSRIVSIYPQFDPHIPGGSHLEGAVNVELSVMGHFRILALPETITAVLEATG